MLVGNNYAQETLFGRYDASIGTILLGDSEGSWAALKNSDVNFMADGDARRILCLQGEGPRQTIVVVNNDGPLVAHVLDDEMSLVQASRKD